jgi:hypothetical protein
MKKKRHCAFQFPLPGIQLCRRDTDRASSRIAGAGVRAPHSHPLPPDQRAGSPTTSRRTRPRVGRAQRKVARRAAWTRSRPLTPTAARRHVGHGASGPRASAMWAEGRAGARGEAAGTRRAGAHPRFQCAPFRHVAVARRRPQRETSPWGICWVGGTGAVESDGGFVRFVYRTSTSSAVGVKLASTRRTAAAR